MLTGKQKRFLRSQAHHLKAIFQIGKDGVGNNQVEGIMDALDSQEMLKVKLLDTCPISVHEAALELSMKTKSDVVHIVGHTIVLYKESDERIYKLP